jgi:hypothetical protein
MSRLSPGLVALVLASGCTTGVGQLQTARTLAPGEIRHMVSAGLDWNFMVDQRILPGNVIMQYAGRYGVRDDLDVGLKLFFGLGALADAKLQVVHWPRLAVSLQGGVGGAYDVMSSAEVVHVPLSLLASYRLVSSFTPYLGVGYGAFWVVNYGDDANLPPGATLAPRAWHGDGVLMLHAGFELGFFRRVCLLLEYAQLRPIVEDPGDRYEFAVNHLFLAGVGF